MPEYKNVTSYINWKDFSGNEIILPICVRSPNVQGRNFTSMLDAIAQRVKNVEVMLCDYLDRHNLDGDGELALKQSKEWQKQYMPEIRKRFKKVNVTAWEEILNNPTFKERHKTISELYQTNRTVRFIIDKNIDCYVRPKVLRISEEVGWDYDLGKIIENSTNYLLEEYAGTAIYKYLSASQTQVYWGIYIADTDAFNRYSGNIDLTLPVTLPVTNKRLGPSIASIQEWQEAA